MEVDPPFTEVESVRCPHKPAVGQEALGAVRYPGDAIVFARGKIRRRRLSRRLNGSRHCRR